MQVSKIAVLPSGFKANAVNCGIRKKSKLDLALFSSGLPAKASCMFTCNKIIAAPLVVCKKHLKAGDNFQAIIVNSGNANCFTGKAGLKDAEEMASLCAKSLGIKTKSVLVASTGIIGKRLPADKIKKAVPELACGISKDGIHRAKKAIMTTDTVPKEITVKFRINGKIVTVCGIAKGAGMIAPNMATLLVFLFTDAKISQGALTGCLRGAVNKSFNCITVDGCMSTNDSVMLLANAAAGNKLISGGNSLKLFSCALDKVCLELAKMVIKDAEGASKFIHIKVYNAKTYAEAKTGALAVANSILFKTAVYGENPNFGRIVASLGSSGIAVKEEDIKIRVSSLKKKEIDVAVGLNSGNSSAEVYTSDLTPKYIKINAEYN